MAPESSWDLTSISILLFMSFLACFTITQYSFQHDQYMSHGDDADLLLKSSNESFVYGPPNAEFDWCERNFLWSIFVAEPVNTITGLFFIVVPITGELLHRDIQLPLPARLVLFFTGLIGVGTVLFHATLRYWCQLLDELPIYYLILLIMLELSNRESRIIRTLTTAWALLVSFLLFYVPQSHPYHEYVRGAMSCTFCLCFVYTFYKISSRASELVDGTQLKKQVQRLFHFSFTFFVIAEISWLIDNSQCQHLRSSMLPFYPHLHAVWHLFAASGIYGLWLCVVALKWAVPSITEEGEESRRVPCVLWWNEVVPYVGLVDNRKSY